MTGLSPQVVTETLYALAVRPPEGRAAFVPTEIHLVTTATGAEHARLNLLSERPGWFHQLRRDYDLPEIAFGPEHLHVLTAASGAALEDIRAPEDNERAADFITDKVRELAADPAAALHVSIAGGRKTMGFYLGYALSLYGRPQDRLSHVLVSPPYESHPQFYYPTPYEYVFHTLDTQHRPLDARKAEVTLASIPFVRLREGLPPRLLRGAASLSQVVSSANRSLEPPRLVLEVRARRALADGLDIPLGPTEFAVLLWIAGSAALEDEGLDWSTPAAADQFLAVARRVYGRSASGGYARIEEALSWRRHAAIKLAKYFEPHKARIARAFEETLGPRAAERYAIRKRKAKGAQPRYFLPLARTQIEIRE
ncbi:MAG: CRISPR-associated ring nuclease Csm6 [Burkholderiales bacterium]|nr:CRISPR-associated ring nuclease Csm6 [Burkholderiales bacterium]